MYYYVLAETDMGLDKPGAAEAAAAKIQDRFLYPKQVEALSGWKQKIDEARHPKPEKTEAAATSK
jgi:hypothetical protein